MTRAITTVATLVPEQQRMSFLPKHFGLRPMIRGELTVYGWLDRLSNEYNGGYWHYYEIPNAFYMAPAGYETLRIVWPLNWCDRTMSADAAGIVATLYALCELCSQNVATTWPRSITLYATSPASTERRASSSPRSIDAIPACFGGPSFFCSPSSQRGSAPANWRCWAGAFAPKVGHFKPYGVAGLLSRSWCHGVLAFKCGATRAGLEPLAAACRLRYLSNCVRCQAIRVFLQAGPSGDSTNLSDRFRPFADIVLTPEPVLSGFR